MILNSYQKESENSDLVKEGPITRHVMILNGYQKESEISDLVIFMIKITVKA